VTDLEVGFHDLDDEPPPGWDAYRRAARLPCAWDWSLMRARAADGGAPHLGLTIRDSGSVVGLGAARLPGLGVARLAGSRGDGARPARSTLAGVLDVDCLVTSALSGLEVEGAADRYAAALTGLRLATRRHFGRRVVAILLRQVPESRLSTATRFASVVLEAPPIGRHTLAYDSFDSYLRGLSSSRRNEFRQIERDRDVVVTYTGRGDARPALDLDAMLAMVNDTVRRHQVHRFLPKRLIGPKLLTAVARHDEVDVVTYEHREGGLLGFGLVLGGGAWPVSWVAGFLPRGPRVRGGLWFHRELLYAKHWIESGVPGYVSGAGTDEAKIRMGHQMTPVWSVLHPLVGSDAPRFLRTSRA
jgi:hypothetical protein